MKGSRDLRIEALKANNYFTWKSDMEAVLRWERLWVALDRESDSWKALDMEKKEEYDEKAKALIQVNVSSSLKTKVASARNAETAWQELEDLFRARSARRQFVLHTQLKELKKGPKEEELEFIARAEALSDEIESACGETVPEHHLVYCILGGLGPKNDDFSKQLKYSDLSNASLEDLTSRLLIVEADVVAS